MFCKQSNFAGVAEWQTRKFQVLVMETSYGFNSHLLHHTNKKKLAKSASFLLLYLRTNSSAFYNFLS